MPRPIWDHRCRKSGSRYWMGTLTCGTCRQPDKDDGWQPTMHEAMAQYQTLYRLKPIGRHRRKTDKLFASVTAKCEACRGHGLRNSEDSRGWLVCNACRGLGSIFTSPAHEIEALRGRVLAAHPEAGANPVRNLFAGPVIFAEATQQVIGGSHPETVGSGPSVSCAPVFQSSQSDGAGMQDVLALIPLSEDVRHLEGVLRLPSTHHRSSSCSCGNRPTKPISICVDSCSTVVMVKPFVEHSGAARFGDERRPAREPDLGDATVWLAAELSILGQMRPSFFTSRVMLSVEPPAAWRCGARRGARRVCDRRALSGGAGGCTRVPSGRAAWPAPRHS